MRIKNLKDNVLEALVCLVCIFSFRALGDNSNPVKGRFLPYRSGDEVFSASLKRYNLKAGIYERHGENGVEQLPFLLFRPKPKRPKTPMLLYFGGTGETGADLSRHFNQRAIFERVTSEEFQSVHPCYLFAPMLRDYREFSGALPERPTACSNFVLEAMLAAIKELGEGAVDTNRLYATGLSFGGCAAFEMICYYPRIFAAALPISAVESEFMIPESSRVNLWCIENRAVLSPKREALYRRMKDRVARSGGDFRMSLFRRKGHNAWNDAWAEDEPWDWLFTKTSDGRNVKMTPKERKITKGATRDLMWATCSSDLKPVSSNHVAKCGADNLMKTYFRADNARIGNWWMLEASDGIVGDVTVITGTDQGMDVLHHGIIECSNGGRHWRTFSKLNEKTGEASFRISRPVKFIRVRCMEKGPCPFVVREVVVRQ